MEVNALFVLFLGMGTVFFGLICLIFLTKLMSAVLKDKSQPQKAPVPVSGQSQAAVDYQPVDNDLMHTDRKLFDAVIAASIASYCDGNMEGMRIHSIRKISSGSADRNELIAVIGAVTAIMTEAKR